MGRVVPATVTRCFSHHKSVNHFTYDCYTAVFTFFRMSGYLVTIGQYNGYRDYSFKIVREECS